MEPEMAASTIPCVVVSTLANGARLTSSAKGTDQTKMPAVSAMGSFDPRPRSENQPQKTPAANISADAAGGGEDTLGAVSMTIPAMATSQPAAMTLLMRSPARNPAL